MPSQIIVAGCIDFRTIEKLKEVLLRDFNLQDGDYAFVATAGAGLNPDIPKLIGSETSKTATFINVQHRDCGYAKQTGVDDDLRHLKGMEQFGRELKARNPELVYQAHLIRMNQEDIEKHHCQALAIIQGSPAIVKEARAMLAEKGLTNNHDEIARLGNLSPNDDSLWTDFGISLKLHQPKQIFIFDDDNHEAAKIVERAKEEAQRLGQSIEVSQVSLPN